MLVLMLMFSTPVWDVLVLVWMLVLNVGVLWTDQMLVFSRVVWGVCVDGYVRCWMLVLGEGLCWY